LLAQGQSQAPSHDRRPAAIAATTPAAAADPPRAARLAQLTYVSDDRPGIQRSGRPGHFVYLRAGGKKVTDAATLARIAHLAIPPAWTDVWICPDPRGHIQATGRDVRRRKQYRYHPRWRQVRDQSKFGRMIAFARALPRIRQKVAADLRRPGLPREKVLALVVRLLEQTCIRVGNDEYARANRHFGITTLQDRHAQIKGGAVRFHFRGKSGKEHAIDLHDPTMARLVRRCRDIPGQRLFQYLDHEGRRHSIGSGDVNAYVREASGADFTAKDFRTWAGTTMVAEALIACGAPKSVAAGNRQVLQAIDAAAERLGNTRAVSRSSYVHPAVIDAFMGGRLALPGRARPTPASRGSRPHRASGLGKLERATLRVLEAAVRARPTARASGGAHAGH
jgi:DNA topoisomerase-1